MVKYMCTLRIGGIFMDNELIVSDGINRLPEDLMQIAFAVVHGYSRRGKQYKILRENIENGSRIRPYYRNTVKRRINTPCNPTLDSVTQLETLDASVDVFMINVVDDGLKDVTSDMPKGERERVQEAIYLNCLSGRKYPYEHFNIAVSRRDFYRRRSRFLKYILDSLGYIDYCFVG
jgi:hypothetical protein